MKKNILIIGGDSFIGSNFINSYLNIYNFKIVSRVKTNFSNELVIKNLFNIPDFFFHNIDVIINFAAIVHRNKYTSLNLYKKINYELPVFLFKKSIKSGIKHFIQMSSISIYERNKIINKDSPEIPSTPYGLYKLQTDNYILGNSLNRINISCIRSPMVYGVNAPGNMSLLIKLAKLRIPLPFKNVDNKLSFININNLSDFLKIVINKKLYGILIPSDKKFTSLSEIIKITRKNNNQMELLFELPNFLKVILRTIAPSLYKKLFESLIVECNIDNKIYNPDYTLEDGIRESLKNKNF